MKGQGGWVGRSERLGRGQVQDWCVSWHSRSLLGSGSPRILTPHHTPPHPTHPSTAFSLDPSHPSLPGRAGGLPSPGRPPGATRRWRRGSSPPAPRRRGGCWGGAARGETGGGGESVCGEGGAWRRAVVVGSGGREQEAARRPEHDAGAAARPPPSPPGIVLWAGCGRRLLAPMIEVGPWWSGDRPLRPLASFVDRRRLGCRGPPGRRPH